MSYVRAEDILPKELIESIQQREKDLGKPDQDKAVL